MGFSSFRRTASIVFDFSRIHQCRQPVRRNASSIFWSGQRSLFASKSSKTSSVRFPNENSSKGATAAGVKALLIDYGFSETQISKLQKKNPTIFKLKAETNLKPKLTFLCSIGFSSAQLPSLVLRNNFLLSSSLENQILPSYNYLKNMPLLDEQIVKAAKFWPGIFLTKLNSTIAPNIELLRSMGLPLSSITFLVVMFAVAICRRHEIFTTIVKKAIDLGIDPLKFNFVVALHVISALSEETWDRKSKLYRSLGLSEDEFLRAFRMHPGMMTLSEKNIVKRMEFFLNELHWTPKYLTSYPIVLSFDLERRIVPRCHVSKMLKARGLVPKWSIPTMLRRSEKKFVGKFIDSYKDDFPELMDIYISLKRPPQDIAGFPIHPECHVG